MYIYEWNNKPAALLMDPKEDGKIIGVSMKWKMIVDKAQLQDAIDRSQFLRLHLLPALYAISGPDEKVWGYVASYATNLNVKYIEDRTMTVFATDPPPHGAGYCFHPFEGVAAVPFVG